MTHQATLGEIVEHLKSFTSQPQTLVMPQIPNNSFIKKLYSTYLSYLPKEKVLFPLKMNCDETEIIMQTDSAKYWIVCMVYSEIAYQFQNDLENLKGE